MNGKDCRNDDVIIEGEFPITHHEMRSEPHRCSKDNADDYSRKIGFQIDVQWSRPCSRLTRDRRGEERGGGGGGRRRRERGRRRRDTLNSDTSEKGSFE